MKKQLAILSILAMAALTTACHEPEYVPMTADRQGLTSLTAIFTTGPYVDQVLGTYQITDPDETEYVIPIPWYFPETSDDPTMLYMTRLRVKAELQPNYKLEPSLSILDLTEENKFTLIDPDGNRRDITITGERRRSSLCSLITLMIDDLMVSGIINEEKKAILIPYKDDLSSVKVSGQVSPHATLAKIGGKDYVATARFNLNTGSTVVVKADDGTEGVYSVTQGDPELIDMGLNTKSVKPLFNIDPVSMLGLPAYTVKAYVSLAGNGNNIVVCVGDGSAPILVNKYNGSKTGTMTLGSAVADVITSDEKENVLIANAAAAGETVNIYKTASTSTAPTLFHSFTNELDIPIGHRMKVLGDVSSDAVIVFTAEGVDGLTTASRAVVLKVTGGAVASSTTVDFLPLGLAWGSAPVNHATVVPASLDPDQDGYFLDYYGENSDPVLAENASADAYILHYINGSGQNTDVDYKGNWGVNPNCLDIKTFNHARYMTLFLVSHFPNWGLGPRMCLYDVTDPSSATLMLDDRSMTWVQKGAYDGDVGAAGDVVISPSADGFRLFVYYYDHHSHAIGAYVADCIKQ